MTKGRHSDHRLVRGPLGGDRDWLEMVRCLARWHKTLRLIAPLISQRRCRCAKYTYLTYFTHFKSKRGGGGGGGGAWGREREREKTKKIIHSSKADTVYR